MKRWLILVMAICLTGCANSPIPFPNSTPTLFPTITLPTQTASAIRTAIPPTATVRPTLAPTLTRTAQPSPTVSLPSQQPTEIPTAPVLVGAGDIAVCDARGDEATAGILDNIEGTVFTLGDNVYPNGTLEQFQKCYEASWGRHKARTRPVPGNHDYNTGGARGYFEYFGARAGDPTRGYYSYKLGVWHILVLNSEIETDENSAQVQWIRDELAQQPTTCTVAMFHRPLFSSGPHGRDGSGEKTRALWNVLYENNVDVILNGHDHDYERFAPQNPQGERDDARGIRQFVVGTGGASPYIFGDPKANSEKRITGPFGVLKLTLHATSYDWEFISIAPLLFKDSGTGECH